MIDYKKKLIDEQLSQELTLLVDGKPTIVPVRVGGYERGGVIIDAVNFVLKGEIFDSFEEFKKSRKEHVIDQNEAIAKLAEEIAQSIGGMVFGEDFLNIHNTGKGLHFYKHAFTIGDYESVLGKICFGGQKDTVLVQITGLGCQFAKKDWEYWLWEYLGLYGGKITRVDLAHDDFEGAYLNVVDANDAETEGAFMLTNKRPSVQMLGDWKHHTGSGRTLQIGKRQNGKLIRIYEKGKELGDKDSMWCRAEVELGSKGRVIPLDVLIEPTQYFMGAYPFTYELIDKAQAHKGQENNINACKIEVNKKEDEIALVRSLQIWKVQIGRYIAAYRDMGIGDTELLDMIQTDKKDNFYPKRLKLTEKLLKDPPTYMPSRLQ